MKLRIAVMSYVAAPALVLALAGCGGDPEPIVADPPPSTAAVTPSVTPIPTPAPVIDPTDPDAPFAYFHLWAQAVVDMQNSGDTAFYRSITVSCASCAKLATQIEGWWAAGGYVRFKGQSVTRIHEVTTPGPTRVFQVSVSASPTEYKQSATAEIETYPGGPTTYEMTLGPSDVGLALKRYIRVEL